MAITKVTQSYTLYRTNGNIDKENNIYFIPAISVGFAPYPVPVSDIWLSRFDNVAYKHSDFRDVNISSWSPEDRTLDINTIPDIFRARGTLGSYDYIIVSRTIYEGDTSIRTRVGYFIDSVEQVGINTTRVYLSKDHFTNSLYLLNTDIIQHNSQEDVDYFNNPLRKIVLNTYVERQHYDRKNGLLPSNDILFYTYKEDLGFNVTKKVEKNVIYYNIAEKKLKLCTKEQIDEINSYGDYNSLTEELKIIVRSLCMAFATIIAKENILSPFVIGQSQITHGSFSNYSTTKSISEGYQRLIYPFVSVPNFLNISNIPKYFGTSFNNEQTFHYIFDYEIVNSDDIIVSTSSNGMVNLMTRIINGGLSPYIQEISVSRYSKIMNYAYFNEDKTEIIFSSSFPSNFTENTATLNENKILFATENARLLEEKKGLFCSKLLRNASYVGKGYESDNPLEMRGLSHETENRLGYFYLLNEGDYKMSIHSMLGVSFGGDVVVYYLIDDEPFSSDIKIELMDNYDDEIITNLYPYKYHSITYAGSSAESKLTDLYYLQEDDNKLKINYDLKLVMSNNVTSKFSMIPYFNNDNYVLSDLIYTPNFNESLTLVLDNDIPLRESSYYSYLYQNKAQMKNQFAVATMSSIESGINTTIKTSSNVATLGALGYTDKAILGGVGGGADVLTTPISHAFNVAKINASQKARLQDVGVKPDTLKSTGTDVFFDLMYDDLFIYFNTYKVDEISKNNVEKYLSRYGYLVDRYDTINMNNRRYINYIKLKSLEFGYYGKLSNEQEAEIKRILYEGVTLTHSSIDNAFYYENDEVTH